MLLLLAIVRPAAAKVGVYGRAELTEQAGVIAVIEVTEATEVNIATNVWTYRQVARARPIDILKGQLPDSFEILANESYDCAQAHYQPGRYLVFLRRYDSGRYTTVGYDQGQLAIDKNGQVMWFSERDRVLTPLADVLLALKAR